MIWCQNLGQCHEMRQVNIFLFIPFNSMAQEPSIIFPSELVNDYWSLVTSQIILVSGYPCVTPLQHGC